MIALSIACGAEEPTYGSVNGFLVRSGMFDVRTSTASGVETSTLEIVLSDSDDICFERMQGTNIAGTGLVVITKTETHTVVDLRLLGDDCRLSDNFEPSTVDLTLDEQTEAVARGRFIGEVITNKGPKAIGGTFNVSRCAVPLEQSLRCVKPE